MVDRLAEMGVICSFYFLHFGFQAVEHQRVLVIVQMVVVVLSELRPSAKCKLGDASLFVTLLNLQYNAQLYKLTSLSLLHDHE